MTAPPFSGKSFISFLSVPRVAASFWRPAKNLSRLRAAGLEIAEIRMDMAHVKNMEEARALMAGYSTLPVILTLRAKNEGGQWQKSETARRNLFLRLLPLAAAADIELSAPILPQIAAAAKKSDKALIISRHNFSAPDSLADMEKAAARAFAAGADIFKTACLVRGCADLPPLRKFLQRWKTHPIIAVGMGCSPAARRARAELPQRGARLAYAAINETSAPGQLPLPETAAAIRAARG